MYTYVNKVDMAINQDHKEVMLSFKQINPLFKEEEPEDGVPRVSATPIIEEVANLIMTEEFAKKLKDLINKTIQ